jgi:hypothetical protein
MELYKARLMRARMMGQSKQYRVVLLQMSFNS